MEATTEQLEATRTAAAVLCLLEGSEAPVQELLSGMASPEQLEQISLNLRTGDRTRRAKVLASHLARLAVQLDAWSLR